MSFRPYCLQCERLVDRCEHIARAEELRKQIDEEAQLECDPQYFSEELERLWLIVYAEDLTERRGEPFHPLSRDEYQAAVVKFESFQERHHELTRQNDCDCHLCKDKGWYIPVPASSKPKKKSALATFLDGDDSDRGDESNCGCGCRCYGVLSRWVRSNRRLGLFIGNTLKEAREI